MVTFSEFITTKSNAITSPGMMDLRERDFLFDTMLQLPSLHTPFESATNRVSDANVTFLTVGRVVLLLEPIQNRVRFQSSILFQEFHDLAPELLERIADVCDTYEPAVRSDSATDSRHGTSGSSFHPSSTSLQYSLPICLRAVTANIMLARMSLTIASLLCSLSLQSKLPSCCG